jgi:methylase of polypeptide subunit release factors
VEESTEHGRTDLPLLRRRLAGGGRFERMVRAFHLGDVLRPGEMQDALGAGLADALLGTGLLAQVDGGIAAAAKVIPYRGLYFASDFPDLEGSRPPPPDYVPGISAASRLLALLTPRTKAAAVLDVGTGNGVHALLAARHAGHVVGTDTNPRALGFSALNAALNGLTNLDWLPGSFYEPVENRTFDLVLCNPPFVISPETRFVYRDSGGRGDSASEHVITSMPNHLRDAAFGLALCNWLHESEDDWAERPREWKEGSGCDVWVIRFDTLDRLGYAAFWLRQTENADLLRYGRLLDEWDSYYREIGMERVSVGAIVMRKRSGGTWFRSDAAPAGRIVSDCGEHIEAIFAAEDLLQALAEDGELLDRRFTLAPAHALDVRMVLRDGGRIAESMVLRLTAGFPFAGEVDGVVVGLLSECAGGRLLRDVVTDLAEKMELDAAGVTGAALAIVKKFLRAGVLRTAD